LRFSTSPRARRASADGGIAGFRREPANQEASRGPLPASGVDGKTQPKRSPATRRAGRRAGKRCSIVGRIIPASDIGPPGASRNRLVSYCSAMTCRELARPHSCIFIDCNVYGYPTPIKRPRQENPAHHLFPNCRSVSGGSHRRSVTAAAGRAFGRTRHHLDGRRKARTHAARNARARHADPGRYPLDRRADGFARGPHRVATRRDREGRFHHS
jgi:hypothetical protein